ncbi:FkbM family methyltransferase [Sphingobium ummariense]
MSNLVNFIQGRKQDAISIVNTLYKRIFLREPDPVGFAHFTESLTSGSMTFDEVLNTLFSSEEFYHKRGAIMHHYHPGRQDAFFNEMSQFGEVSTLLRAMISTVCTNRIIVDVGVLGVEGSNSYDLMRWFGWRGLLVEANPALIDSIKEQFGPLDYKIVNVAVSDYEGTATLHIGTTDSVSSLSESHTQNFGPSAGKTEVRVETLPAILEREHIPHDFDLLSIDIEGEDVKVLNHMISSSSYRPNWIIFESGFVAEYRPGLLRLIPEFDAEYELVGKTEANLIFRYRSFLKRMRGEPTG